MKIELKEITVRKLTDGFLDSAEQGVVAYSGKLDIRPPYQREFIYKDKQRDAVIDTVRKDFPLNVMYWSLREDGFEVIDGQQRTLSICQYVNGDFSIKGLAFHNLKDDQQNQILDYKLMGFAAFSNSVNASALDKTCLGIGFVFWLRRESRRAHVVGTIERVARASPHSAGSASDANTFAPQG